MPRIRDILPAIMALRSGVIDQALSVALAHAEDDELADLADAMLDRSKANGIESLIAQYHRLTPHTQHRLVDQAEQFATSIRRAASHRESPTPALNALAIIEQAASARLAYLATAMCRHTAPLVREQAGRCIISLATRAATTPDHHASPHLDALSTSFLLQAVEQGVVQYNRHDRPELLLAMLWLMPRPMPEAVAALSQPEHTAVHSLCKTLQQQPGPATRRALFTLVGIRTIADASRQALASANAAGKLAETLEQGHLLSLTPTRAGLARLRQHDTVWPNAQQQRSMPSASRRWLPTYLGAVCPNAQEQAARLAPLARTQDTATRLAVLRKLITLACSTDTEHKPVADNANDTLAVMTRDPEPAIARTALWHLIHIDYTGLPRILADLVNSRHPTIRQVASSRLAPLGFEKFWQAWPKLDPKRRFAAGRALIKIDESFHNHLANRLASRAPDTRIRALVIIATLNQGIFFEEVLLDLCGSDDERIVASAVRALSGCTSQATQQALQLALDHDDTRIRANALEALGQSQASANLDKLFELANDPAQRPRANAIKALLELRTKDALPSLMRMLSDQRPGHRISALWLIDEMGILQLARIVAEMSLSDEDTGVKKRASQVIQNLIEDLEHHADNHAHTHAQPAQDPANPTEAA